MKSVALIQPPCPRLDDDSVDPPMGLIYLGTLLRFHGHKVHILDFSGGNSPKIPECDYYGFTTLTPTYGWTVALRDGIRWQNSKATFIAGGAHATALSTSMYGWDYIVVGEGERAILDIVEERVSPGIVQGISTENLDLLPFPDFSLVDLGKYTQHIEGRKTLPLVSSRGCPYRCAFCNSILYHAKRVRFRTPQNIVSEIENFIKVGYTAVKFSDDLFSLSLQRVRDLTTAISPLSIWYRCQIRVDNFTEEMAKLLASSGCKRIAIGVESGSEKMLKLMNKQQTVEQARRAIYLARKCGLYTCVYLMVGFPGETWETLKETRDFMLETQPNSYGVYAPVPYPGTAISLFPQEFGIKWINPNFNEYMHIEKNGKTNYLISHITADARLIEEMRTWLVEELQEIRWFGKDIGRLRENYYAPGSRL